MTGYDARKTYSVKPKPKRLSSLIGGYNNKAPVCQLATSSTMRLREGSFGNIEQSDLHARQRHRERPDGTHRSGDKNRDFDGEQSTRDSESRAKHVMSLWQRTKVQTLSWRRCQPIVKRWYRSLRVFLLYHAGREVEQKGPLAAFLLIKVWHS